MKKVFYMTAWLVAAVLLAWVAINVFIALSTTRRIVKIQDVPQADGILVLGASVIENAYPCAMLEDRLNTAISLYEYGVSDRIIVSGDHRRDDYNEVKVMQSYVASCGVPQEHIQTDHEGISTYDSIRHASLEMPNGRIVIVTQRYHLYRALYIARAMGLDAYGVAADARPYADFWYNQARESLARIKDFIAVILRPESSNIEAL